jgi:hypothetical protein
MKSAAARYSASYSLRDPESLLKALRCLREFSGVSSEGGVEELVWTPPSGDGGRNGSRPVATLLLNGQQLRIETGSRQALHALQLLVENVSNVGAVLVSSESRGLDL